MVVLELLSPSPLTNRSDGRDIFELWRKHLPELLPDLYGNWEPVDRRFDYDDLEAMLDQWTWPFLAVKKRPRVDTSVFMRKAAQQRIHAAVIVRTELGAASEEHLLNFLTAASLRFNADFAYLHLATEAELEMGKANRTARKLDKQGRKFTFSVPSEDPKRRIPDLYWATVLGAPYVDMFGQNRLLSSPAHAVTAISGRSVLLQLTEHLVDVGQDHISFCDVRTNVKNHLGPEAFFDAANDRAYTYRIPEFKFSDAAGS